MIEIFRWSDTDKKWTLVERVREHDYLRDDLKEEIAMIDAAGGTLDGIGARVNDGEEDARYYLDDNTGVSAGWIRQAMAGHHPKT